MKRSFFFLRFFAMIPSLEKFFLMLKTSLKQKFLLFSCSVIVCLLLLELVLRAAGLIHLALRDRKNQAKLNSLDSYRVLCIGESTTYLGGDNNYPNYLSQILNSSGLGKMFTVVNKGTPGVSTDFIVANAASWIDQYQPDFAVVMMGINDDMLIARDQGAARRLLSFLKETRIYKLAQWISLSFKKRFSKEDFQYSSMGTTVSSESSKTENLQTFMDQFFDRINRTDPEYRKLYKAAVLLEGMKQYHRSEDIFKALISGTDDPVIQRGLQKKLGDVLARQGKYIEFLNITSTTPHNYWNTDWIEDVCGDEEGFQRVESALHTLMQTHAYKLPFYSLLARCYEHGGKPAQAEEYRQKSKKTTLEDIHPATQKNFLELALLLSQRDVTPIFVQYPVRSIDPLKKILGPAKNFHRLIFVDNEKLFKDAVEQEGTKEYFNDLFAWDFGHCTEKGNRLLAQNIASALIKYIKK